MQEVFIENVDILAIAEIRIDKSLATSQFLLVEYHHSIILVYVKSSIPPRRLNFTYLPYKMQAISFKLKLNKGEMNSNIYI